MLLAWINVKRETLSWMFQILQKQISETSIDFYRITLPNKI